jgi:hypothetical protein
MIRVFAGVGGGLPQVYTPMYSQSYSEATHAPYSP